MKQLRDQQLWLAGAVMTDAELDDVDVRLTRGPKMGPRERLDIYRRGYESRLVECLADDYPVLKVALGDDTFDELCRGYVARYPSEAPNLNAYGRRMADHCKGSWITSHVVPKVGRDFAADLARLEWAIVEVVHEAADAPLTMERLAAIPMEAWAGARLVASRALRLLDLQYPANDYFQAVRDDEPHDVPGPGGPSATVVYRSGHTVWRMGLTPPMHRVLAALVGGKPLEAALSLAGDGPPERVSAWFREWVSSGLFVAVDVG